MSPVLANVFLHDVLDLWFAKKYRPQARGDCHLVRYADDFLCLVQEEQDAKALAPALRERFAKFGWQLHPDKTRVIRMDRRAMVQVRDSDVPAAQLSLCLTGDCHRIDSCVERSQVDIERESSPCKRTQ